MEKKKKIVEQELLKQYIVDYDALLEATEHFSDQYALSKKQRILQRLSAYEDVRACISTGIADIDTMLEGGIPVSKIVQIFGKQSTAKTSLCMHIAAKTPIAVYIDCESSFEKARAVQFGIDPDRCYIARPETGEQAIDIIKAFADRCPYPGAMIIVVDSVPAMVPQKQIEIDEKYTSGRQSGVGLTATLLSRHIWSIAAKCRNTGATVIFVNQLRDKIGYTFPFGEKTYTPGGWALKYALTLDIRLERKALLKVSNTVLGLRLIANVTKNKITFPFQTAEFDFILDSAKFISLDQEKQALKEAKKRYTERKMAYFQALGKDVQKDAHDDEENIIEEAVDDDDEDEI